MKIAVIAHAHYPIRTPYSGGMEAHTHQMVNELVRQGHDVTLFCKGGSQTDAKQIVIAPGDQPHGKDSFYDKGYLYAMKRIAMGGYDLIINNSLHYTVLRMHTTRMTPMLTIFHTPPFWEMADVLAASTPQTNRTYAAVSDFTAAQWSKYVPAPVHTVLNGLDLSGWLSRTDPPTKQQAAWVGRITPEKGVHLALQACIGMDLPIVFGGSVYDQMYFDAHIRPLLDNPNVTYVGHADRKQVNDMYRNASVAVITPLWDEPFGLAAIEAMASGTPVAAFGRGGLRSVITAETGVLAADGSVRSLQAAIREASQLNRMSCVSYAMGNFTLERMVSQYLELVSAPVETGVADTSLVPALSTVPIRSATTRIIMVRDTCVRL